MFILKELLEKVGLAKIDERKIRWAMVLGIGGIILIALASWIPGSEKGPDNPPYKSAAAATDGYQADGSANTGAAAADGQVSAGSGLDELARYASHLEAKTRNILSKVSGAGKVWVTINMEQGTEEEYATNQTTQNKTTSEKDPSGNVKSTTESTTTAQVVAMRTESQGEHPVLVTRVVPRIAGVLVVAEGAREPRVKLELSEAASTLLGVPPHKILITGTDEGR